MVHPSPSLACTPNNRGQALNRRIRPLKKIASIFKRTREGCKWLDKKEEIKIPSQYVGSEQKDNSVQKQGLHPGTGPTRVPPLKSFLLVQGTVGQKKSVQHLGLTHKCYILARIFFQCVTFGIKNANCSLPPSQLHLGGCSIWEKPSSWWERYSCF